MRRNHQPCWASDLLRSMCVCILWVRIDGCAPTEPKAALHEPNYLYMHAMEIGQDMKLEQPFSDSQDLLNEWFGTLDDPKLPPLFEDDDIKEFLSLEKVKMAAGPAPTTKEPGLTGLYRQQCASCHGESGQGRGPVAASQNPYPASFVTVVQIQEFQTGCQATQRGSQADARPRVGRFANAQVSTS